MIRRAIRILTDCLKGVVPPPLHHVTRCHDAIITLGLTKGRPFTPRMITEETGLEHDDTIRALAWMHQHRFITSRKGKLYWTNHRPHTTPN